MHRDSSTSRWCPQPLAGQERVNLDRGTQEGPQGWGLRGVLLKAAFVKGAKATPWPSGAKPQGARPGSLLRKLGQAWPQSCCRCQWRQHSGAQHTNGMEHAHLPSQRNSHASLCVPHDCSQPPPAPELDLMACPQAPSLPLAQAPVVCLLQARPREAGLFHRTSP